jgi:GAT domain-containing protein
VEAGEGQGVQGIRGRSALKANTQHKTNKTRAPQAPASRNHKSQPGGRTLNAPPFDPHSQNYFSRSHSSRRLPEPVELANRLEEARTSAKLLQQVVSCTPPAEILDHELIREFADRCHSASRSIQGYMSARDPGPDNDTMESLIDTNEQLQQALNQHQRAVLNARKHLGLGERSQNASPAPSPGEYTNGRGPPQLPTREGLENRGKGKGTELPPLPPAVAGPSRSQSGTPREDENPFRDPQPEPSRAVTSSRPAGPVSADTVEPRLALEPFNPGFSLADSDRRSGSDPAFLQQRQESAIRNTTMRGAADGADAGPTPGVSREDNDGMYDDDDTYDSAAKGKQQPMYRY